jgi:predicted nuclease of restriction endonuclease-like (RecB) superfamily
MNSNLPLPPEATFTEVLQLIQTAQQQAFKAVNTAMLGLYWQIGAIISKKLDSAEWGDAVVNQLAQHIAQTQPGLRGFTRPNLFRMKLFYETYRNDAAMQTLVMQLPWTHNLIIMGQAKRT